MLLCAVTLVVTACGSGAGNRGNEISAGGSNIADAEELWTMLSGYWSYIDTSDDPEGIYDGNIFNFFGYDDHQKPISFVIWGFEADEREYATQVTAIDEHRYRITATIPADKEGGLSGEPHEAMTKSYEIDLSRYADKHITLSSDGHISEWKYAGKEMPL